MNFEITMCIMKSVQQSHT